MQGLVYWIGHRHSLYHGHPLTEGALVAEVCNLLHANLGANEILLCEEQYSRLTANGELLENLPPLARADLVVVAGITRKRAASEETLASHVVAVAEVKRALASKAEIDQDLDRLAKLKLNTPDVRAFLVVVSESQRPDRFVTPNGNARRAEKKIAGINAHYSVVRVCKANAASRSSKSAHYGCVIEVFAD